MKKPVNGDWYEFYEVRYLCIGVTACQAAMANQEGGIRVFTVDHIEAIWKHLPGCTGWEWQEEALLHKPKKSKSKPIKIQAGMTATWTPSCGGEQMTVKITGNDHGRVYCTQPDGSRGGDYEGCFEPVESPDDWVTQDRMPDRAGIDEYRWLEDGLHSAEWKKSRNGQVSFKHGRRGSGCAFEVRCRRKDLPKIEPKTRTVTLTLFLCWDREGEEELRWRIDPPLEWNYRHNTGETKTIEVPL